MSRHIPGVRYAEVDRDTAETSVRVVIDLDGGDRQDVATGIGFFDHMLELMAFHGSINLGVQAEGDIVVDDHHTVEDVGIVIGKAMKEALGTSPIERYASNHTAMDDALVLIAVDFSGRGRLYWEVDFKREKIGELSTEAIREFFQGFCSHASVTLHVKQISGFNEHHLCEAIFKGFGRAVYAATRESERRTTNSTKGQLD